VTIETLEDLLAITSTLTENEALRNVANCVMTLTEVTRYHNGKGRARTYNGDIDAIAGAARQLADMVIMMLEDDNAVPVDAIREIMAERQAHGMRPTDSAKAVDDWLWTRQP
jgi:hypothetical protein